MRRICRCAALLLVGAVAGLSPCDRAVAADDGNHVLLITQAEPSYPAVAAVTNEIRTAFAAGWPEPVHLYSEHLDLGRFSSDDYLAKARAWLKDKYAHRKPDVVIAGGFPILRILLEAPDDLWRDVPIVFCFVDRRTLPNVTLPPNVTGYLSDFDYDGTVEDALSLLPDARRVAIITGSGPTDQLLGGMARAQLSSLGARVSPIDLGGMSIDALLNRVARLEEDTIVLYVVFERDAAGKSYVPHNALAMLADASSRPIFSNANTFLGRGIVGGRLIDFNAMGRDVAEIVLQLLRGASPADIPIRTGENRRAFDARQLQKWGIPESRLPRGSEVQFGATSIWERYAWHVIGALILVFVETTLITLLLIERRSRRRAEREQRRLSGRLIAVHEEERARIARDLHDDLSQRLALTSIELDQLSPVLTDSTRGAGDEWPKAIAEKLREISADVHRLCHNLHPSRLDHLGLGPALMGFCREAETSGKIAVEFTQSDLPPDLSPELALCVFRVVQEALQNVIKHGRASHAAVSVIGHSESLVVTIADDGVGFDPDKIGANGGLGLIGMRERLRLVGGRMVIRSAVSKGTRIEVSVPLTVAKPHLAFSIRRASDDASANTPR